MTSIGEKLNELEENKFDLEKLKNDENFISVMMNASQMALRTHQEEKLDALRNAILNVAKGEAPDESVQHLFLNFVDFFTAPVWTECRSQRRQRPLLPGFPAAEIIHKNLKEGMARANP